MATRYLSPLTGDVWPDVRSVIGTIIGLANFLNEKRPRRKPSEGHDAAIALATEAAGSFSGIPKIVRVGEVEGRQISDAYWQAKDARVKISTLLDEDFRKYYLYWADYCRALHDAVQKDADSGGDWLTPRVAASAATKLQVPFSTRALRLAWYAAWLTEKGTANGNDIELGPTSLGHHAFCGALAELDDAEVDRGVAAGIERIWRFVVAAGRMPRLPEEENLLAAFEAALMADETEFAMNLAKHGYGFKSPSP